MSLTMISFCIENVTKYDDITQPFQLIIANKLMNSVMFIL